jgi:hypothetical protein
VPDRASGRLRCVSFDEDGCDAGRRRLRAEGDEDLHHKIATEAIHILGGYGYMQEYVVERLARDAKLLELGGGTTEMQILTIARHILRG